MLKNLVFRYNFVSCSMAKQAGEIKIIGTLDDLTFYKMGEGFYVRLKSSLKSKAYWTSKVFAGSRRSGTRFGKGNQLASFVYNSLPLQRQYYPLFCGLKTLAISLLKQGKGDVEVIRTLRKYVGLE